MTSNSSWFRKEEGARKDYNRGVLGAVVTQEGNDWESGQFHRGNAKTGS